MRHSVCPGETPAHTPPFEAMCQCLVYLSFHGAKTSLWQLFFKTIFIGKDVGSCFLYSFGLAFASMWIGVVINRLSIIPNKL